MGSSCEGVLLGESMLLRDGKDVAKTFLADTRMFNGDI